MPTFANTINGNEILAKRSQCDYAGNDIQTTYATKSEVTTGLASKQDTISDLATIRSGAADGATAVQPDDLATVATTGAYSDLSGTPTIPPALSAGDGIDITNNVVSADVAAPLAINTDDEIWLKTGRGLDTQAGLQSDELEVRLSGTGGLMYDSNDDDGLAIQLAQYSGLEVQMNNGVQEGLNVLVDGTTIDKNASGELTVIGGGGGGTQADWTEDDPTNPSYIENKPTPKTLTAGTNITVTENSSTITISATWQNAQADWTESDPTQPAYIQHKPTIPTVDQTYDGTSANAQSGVAVADAIGNLPTNLTPAQIQALKEALGVDETVLYSGDAVAQAAFNLSESLMNFETVKVWIRSKVDSLNPISIVEVPTTTIGSTLFLFATERFNSSWQWITWRFDYTVSNSGTTLQLAANAYGGSKSDNAWGAGANVMADVHVYKVIGIHRIASNTPATPDPELENELG